MAVTTLVATAGAANANTYCLRAVANQYHTDRPAADTVWSSATDAEKDAALLFATKLMDSMFEWKGWAVDGIQALSWPRTGLLTRNRYQLPSTTIPVEVQYATAEFARQLLAGDRTGDNDVETQGLTHLGVGSVVMDFKEFQVPKVVPDLVRNLIPCEWGYVRGRSGVTQLVRA
jgi:hypothetical protein